ncbi:MAG TPA: MFS transporter [Acidimicrobiales bacterium]|nr:MFS transporter [Acidimicrobiales bacterium]
MRRTFRALRNRNYRLFWFGQLVSLCGSWMQTTAIAWLVLKDLHAGGTVLGLVVAVQFLPTLVGGSWAGVIADRFDKRRILLGTQSFMALSAGTMAVLTLTGTVTLWMVFALAAAMGMATMFDNPTRQAFVTEMVGPDDLANAVGLNSAGFNVARILGPAIAGILIATAGTGICFALNAGSFIAVIGGLAAMRTQDLYRAAPVAKAKGQIREGLRYALSVPELRMALGLLAVVGTFAMNFTVLIPLVAKNLFHGNASTLGWLTAVMGVGSLIGALFVASRARPTPGLLASAAIALGVLMCAAAVAPTLAWEYLAFAFTGVAAISFMSTCNATVQLASRPDMRGRVMALYMVLFLGSTPVGGPIVGWVGQHFGAQWSLALGGVPSILVGLVAGRLLLRRRAEARTVPLLPEALTA